MTDKYIEISKKAAEISGLGEYNLNVFNLEKVYLVHDNGACAELAVEYRISIIQYKDGCVIAGYIDAEGDYCKVIAKLADHNDNHMLATNYAILSAVIEIERQRNG